MKQLTIKTDNKEIQCFCEENSLLSQAIKASGVQFHFPCGGKGICGKCRVRRISGELSPPEPYELAFLSQDDLRGQIRIACFAKVQSNVVVEPIWNLSLGAQILSDYYSDEQGPVCPLVKRFNVVMSPPDIDDQRDDYTRLKDSIIKVSATNSEPAIIGLNCSRNILQSLPRVLRENDFHVQVTMFQNELLEIGPTREEQALYGIAVDIGTTTVVLYLVNLIDGNVIDTVSMLNSQKSYGDDVISRINYTIENADGAKRLHRCVINQLNGMIEGVCKANQIHSGDIAGAVIASNTSIAHFFAGFDAKHIALAPFTPVYNDHLVISSSELGLDFCNGFGKAIIIAGMSAYVGGDILSGIAYSKMYQEEAICLLIDIGTNGEIVLGNRHRMLCCSTAAGPAFEGCHIQCGVGGISGAVNRVFKQNGKLAYTTIGEKEAIGICGSGILDLICVLLEDGTIDETGRLETDLFEGDMEIFPITENIFITAKDVREVQLAKAAICAGILTLMHEMGIEANEIQKVYLCGGFGNYMDKDSAVSIGLIPKELRDKIIGLGNSAGSGAVRILLDNNLLSKIEEVKRTIQYIELSASPYFQDEYIMQMCFE